MQFGSYGPTGSQQPYWTTVPGAQSAYGYPVVTEFDLDDDDDDNPHRGWGRRPFRRPRRRRVHAPYGKAPYGKGYPAPYHQPYGKSYQPYYGKPYGKHY